MADFDTTREDGLEGLEEEPRRRPWVMVAIVILAALALLAGVQWQRVADREGRLRAEVQLLHRENETLRLQVKQATRQAGELEQKLQALAAERRELAQRVEQLERRASVRPPAKPASKR
jgi:hypothetical protein